ncbi:hypothetical protein ANOM_009752 [Aspergillus nomiae NRRL 13137]|uniref:NACHT domain-containing protein n=1 Tax=Aspergillus nomiae NRRL (strain ATCC 15546 / NRRL 13137 / CBS 260.88 / M93) TaxID=1509407 RepID=A0A0L1IT67_ASPN3|nr:uncharacterized protein ANOM_009752 [Aspergillus nomiae NRRL 13137]KNG82575.1 hypothetical protein ANOM_009752 [Aspergillus nomiae NRRL 13137]
MLGKLRVKLCCGCKGETSDDTEENFRPADLSQKGKDRVASVGGHSREAAKKTQNADQQDEAKSLGESENDGVGADVSPISRQHSKRSSLEKDRKLDDLKVGPRFLDEQENDHKQVEAEIPKCPMSETTPAGDDAADRSDRSGNADLWQRAFDQLNEDLKRQLREDEAKSPENAIKEVIDSTKESFKAYQNGGLKFKKYNGEEVNVREVAKRILDSAIHCSEIIKGIAAFDPTNHASSVWTIVSLGLTMTKNSVDQREAAFKSSEFLADILARYLILDEHCRNKELASSDGLDNAIVQVYKAVLEYTAEVKKRQKASVLNRIGNSIFPVSDTELNLLQSAVKDQDKKAGDWREINNIIYQSKKGDEILASIEKVYQNTETIKAKVNLDERDRVLKWLSDIQYSHTQNDHQRVRTHKTGDWLLSSDEYREWKATPGKFLWLYGPAGCGKSILCSTIIQDIAEDHSNGISYWYFQFSRNETQNVKNMTRSIIRQLAPEELPRSLVNLWKEHGPQGREPDQDKFATVLHDVINSHTGDHLFLIFDALDECPDNEVHERDLLFQVLKGLIDEYGEKLHLLATSRFEENIRCHLEESVKIDLEDRMNDDVEAFVRNALDHGKLSRWKKEKGVHDQILAKLLDTKEPRRFRWADLLIKRLEKCKKRDQITESLGTIPKTLEETYQQILQDIPEDEKEDARSILTWLSFSLVPLKLEAVAAVVGFPYPESVVETCTTYLVTFSPSNGTIKLAHFSVKEFLVVSDSKHWYQLTTIGGHMDIANRALDDLLDQTKPLTEESAHGLPLLEYAADYWGRHFSELTDSDAKSLELEEKIYRLFEGHIVFLNWRRVARDDFEVSSWDTGGWVVEPPIWLACKMGMQRVVARLLSQGANPCPEPPYIGQKDIFVMTASHGHAAIVKQLLENIEISAKVASSIVRSINLNKASDEEADAFLNILLSAEVLYHKHANGCVLVNEDFVAAAAGNSQSGHRLMRLLLDRQDKLEVPVTARVLLAVILNSKCGEETMRVLLDRRRTDIRITERLMQEVACRCFFNSGISTLVLHLGTMAPVNQWFVSNFVTYAPVEVLELLLQIDGDKVQITEELLVEAATRRCHDTVFPWLWKRVPGIKFTSESLQRIASGRHGLECMELILGEYSQGYFLAQEILQQVAESEHGLPLMRMLLDRREAGIVGFDVSEATMMAAANNRNCPQQMMELVINANPEILINEKIVRSAVMWGGASALEYLLELDKNLQITEDLLVLAAGAYEHDNRLLELIFNKFPDAPVTDRVFEEAREYGYLAEVLSVWLERGRHVQDCQMIGRLLEQGVLSVQVLMKLVNDGLIEIDDNLVDAIGIQNALIMAFYGRHAMEKLLNLRENDIIVTEEVILEALDEFGMDDEVYVDDKAFKMLTDRLGSAVLITEKILEKAFLNGQSKLLDFLLQERDWNLQKVWDAIWRNDGLGIKCIVRGAENLLKYREFDVSQTLLEFLPRKWFSKNEDFIELANLCAGRDISAPAIEMLSVELFECCNGWAVMEPIDQLGSTVPMTQKVWDALWRGPRDFAQKVIISNILLQNGEFDISQILLKFLPLKEEQEGFRAKELDELVNLCIGQDISAPATKILTEILFEHGLAHSIKRFIHHKPTFQLTDGLIQRAERNTRAYKKVLMPFLYSKRAADQNIKAAETKAGKEEA